MSKTPERANEPRGPGCFGPTGVQSLHLEIDRHLSTLVTAQAARLAELAAHFTMGTFQQGRGAHEFASDPIMGREAIVCSQFRCSGATACGTCSCQVLTKVVRRAFAWAAISA